MPIKIAITDDHPIVIDGLVNALSPHPEIIITGTYLNGASLFKGLQVQVPDVLLLDLQLPDRNGSELVPLILKQYPELHILILSGMESSPYIHELMEKGCKGYLLKSTTSKVILLDAIQKVYKGELFLDSSLKEQLLRDMFVNRRARNKLEPKMTTREKEVLKLIAAEYSNQQIADELFVSLRTVETHRYNLMQKLEAKNTASLVRIALTMGL